MNELDGENLKELDKDQLLIKAFRYQEEIKKQSKKLEEWASKYHNLDARYKRLEQNAVTKKELDNLQLLHDKDLVELNKLRRLVRRYEKEYGILGTK